MFVENLLLNCVLQVQFDRLEVPLKQNSPELLYDVVLTFCRVGLAFGRKTYWPGSDLRLVAINQCYRYIYQPLTLLGNPIESCYTALNSGLLVDEENLIDDVRRRICLVYDTRLYTPARPKAFYSHALHAMGHSWMITFPEWEQMWRLLQGKRPQYQYHPYTSTGYYWATSFEIVDDPENRGFSIIQMHWKKRHPDNNFNIEVLLDVVARTENPYETTKALHAAIAQRYPRATLFVDCKTSQAHVYRALGYTSVPSLSAQMGMAMGSEEDFEAFLAHLPARS